MYPKYFFERFWDGQQRNELFVCMPFDDSLDDKFNDIVNGDVSAGFETATRVKEDWEPNVITDKIFDGIANSKMILFDLTHDPKLEPLEQSNINVVYELGIANSIREPEDLLLIKEEPIGKLPFDISGLTVIPHPENMLADWL